MRVSGKKGVRGVLTQRALAGEKDDQVSTGQSYLPARRLQCHRLHRLD